MKSNFSFIPVTVDVPFAAALIGFRPQRLPPLPEGSPGIPIGHIQSGQWAERVGLKEGDLITHVNGRGVSEMSSGEEFVQGVSDRPLRLTLQLRVSASELSDVIQSFDWTARFEQIERVRHTPQTDPKETNQMFDRLFSAPLEYDSSSGLFDFSKWMDSRKAQSEPAIQLTNATKESEPQETLPIEPPKPVVSMTGLSDELRKKNRPPTTRTILKWVASDPLCVWFKIEKGFDLPTRAGTLNMDYYFQPFSAEPFIELSLISSPASEITLNEILDSKPIERSVVIQTPVCDSNFRWDYSGTLRLTSNAFNEGDITLVGKLLDYRRLGAPCPMGVFAIRLDALEICDDIAKVDPHMISFTMIDAYTFDVSKSKVRMAVCLRGRQVSQTEAVKRQSPTLSGVASSESSPAVSSPSSLKTETPSRSPPPEASLEPAVKQGEVPQYTPFQRAYRKAMNDIRNGDNSPIQLQNYTLR
jgi:hypothetical protein